MPYKLQTDRAARQRYLRSTPKGKAYRKAHDKKDSRLCGVDGEGGNIDGRHEYLLLRAGDNLLHTGHPLESWECLDFIAGLPTRDSGQSLLYISYYFDYDTSMILRDLPPDVIRQLWAEYKCGLDHEHTERCKTQYVFHGPWKLKYIQGKHLTVGLNMECLYGRLGKCAKVCKCFPPVTIHDTASYFQGSFLSALKANSIGTDAELEQIKLGKELRAGYDGVVSADEISYNELECRLLETMIYQLRDQCKEAGYSIGTYEGPGSVAAEALNAHGVGKHYLPTDLTEYAIAAYYGGRFEPPAIGPVGDVYESDINSAYPAAMLSLPCLEHGIWRKADPAAILSGINPYPYVANIQYVVGPDDPGLELGWFPYRVSNGNIHYPLIGSGWYLSPEVNLAITNGVAVYVSEAWELVKDCDCHPFAWVADLYARRKAVGKGSGEGKVLKLILNSLYGKLCQSVGVPSHANPFWAGLITSTVRAKLRAACIGSEADVYMLATDGIYSAQPLKNIAPDPTTLGEWEVIGPMRGMHIIQAGIYFTGDEAKVKTRGVPARELQPLLPAIRATWDADNYAELSYPIPRHLFHGVRSALHRNRPDLIGVWEDKDSSLHYRPQSKRDAINGSRLLDTGGLVFPPYRYPCGSEDYEFVPSTGSKATLGGYPITEESMMLSEQPDRPDYRSEDVY